MAQRAPDVFDQLDTQQKVASGQGDVFDQLDANGPTATPAPSVFTGGDFQTMPGSRIYNPNRLGSQPLPYASMGAAVSGAMARGQMPDFPQQVQQSQYEAAGQMPAIGAAVGAEAGIPGMAIGAGMGEIAKARMRGQKSSYQDVLTTGGGTYVGGKALEAAVPYLASRAANIYRAGGEAVDRTLSKWSGFTEAAGKAGTEYADAGDAYTQAIRQRRITADINRARYEEAKGAFEAKQERIPEAAPGSQSLWVDLNKSIGVRPSDIRVKSGAGDLGDAVVMPGRGLSYEGLKASDLERMTPTQQNSIVAPKWNRAGRAVDQAADLATRAGQRVDVSAMDNAIEAIDDPATRKSFRNRVTKMTRDMGIRAPNDWTNATPTQAVQLRRALWQMGDNGEAASRAVTDALRKSVPQMKAVDQQYTDLNAAMNAIRRNFQKYSTGGLKYAADAAEFTHPSYLKVPKVPDMPLSPSYETMRGELMGKLRNKFIKGTIATGAVGTGAYDALTHYLASRSSGGP